MQKTYPPVILSLRVNEFFYGLLLIEKGDDESLYIKLPNSRRYTVKSLNRFDTIPHQVTLVKNVTEVFDPYISYHQSGAIHLNAKDMSGKKISFVKDKSSAMKLSLLQSTEFVPFCSFLLPVNIIKYDSINHLKIEEMNYFEKSPNPKMPRKEGLKKPSIIVVDRSILPANAILYPEIFIHRKLDDQREELEFSPAQKQNLIEQITVNNDVATISYTMLLKYITAETQNPEGELVVNVFSREQAIALSLV